MGPLDPDPEQQRWDSKHSIIFVIRRLENSANVYTEEYSLQSSFHLKYGTGLTFSSTVHLYCAVEKRQMSANCRTETLIFFTALLELF
jgi:hypothetical protein